MQRVQLIFLDNFDLLVLCLRLFHTPAICNQTFHGVLGGWLVNHLDLFALFFCSSEALLVRCNTFDRVFGLPDSLVNGLVDVLIDSILRLALGAFGSSIHETIEISLSLCFRNREQHQHYNTPEDTCHNHRWPSLQSIYLS